MLWGKYILKAHKRVTGAKAAQAEDDEEDEGAFFAQTVKKVNTGPRSAGRQEFYAAQQAALELKKVRKQMQTAIFAKVQPNMCRKYESKIKQKNKMHKKFTTGSNEVQKYTTSVQPV